MKGQAFLMNQARKGILSSLWNKPIDFIKDLKTVTVAVHYTTKSGPDIQKGKEMTFDIDKLTRFMRRGERDMAAYQYKILWLNEMGEEQEVFVETREERNTKMQALADDGYSPIWREVPKEEI